MTDKTTVVQTYKIYIKAKPQAIWDAITKPDCSERYAYGGSVSYELKAGGAYHHKATAEMKSMGMPEEMVVGQVVECDPPRKLVQTWHPQFTPEMIAEPPSRLTYEVQEFEGGVCLLTLSHDVTRTPLVGGMVTGGGEPARGGGGWPWVLSDLKSLLESGARM